MSKLDEILKKLCEHAASEGGNGDLVFTALDYGRPKRQVKDLFKDQVIYRAIMEDKVRKALLTLVDEL